MGREKKSEASVNQILILFAYIKVLKNVSPCYKIYESSLQGYCLVLQTTTPRILPTIHMPNIGCTCN